MTDLGARLYETVREYAGLGAHHRTGTAEDARTLDWFDDRLRGLGAATERQPWTFDRYDAEWSVAVDGAEVARAAALLRGHRRDRLDDAAGGRRHRGVGRRVSRMADHRGRRARDRRAAGGRSRPDRRRAGSSRQTDAGRTRVGTAGAPRRGRPGRAPAGRVRARPARRARRRRAHGEVIGRIGAGRRSRPDPPDHPAVRLVSLRGERGTGIAVMLAVAERLAAEGVPLLVNGNSGHGARRPRRAPLRGDEAGGAGRRALRRERRGGRVGRRRVSGLTLGSPFARGCLARTRRWPPPSRRSARRR